MDERNSNPRRQNPARSTERRTIDGRPAARRSASSPSPSSSRTVYRSGTGKQHPPRASHNNEGWDSAQREFRKRQRIEAGEGHGTRRQPVRNKQNAQPNSSAPSGQIPQQHGNVQGGHRSAAESNRYASQRTVRNGQQPARQQRGAHAAQQARHQQRSARSARSAQSRPQRVATQDGLSYQNIAPRRGTNTYVQHGYSAKKSRLPLLIGAGVAAVLVVFLLVNLVGALTAPAQNQQDESLETNDAALTTTSLTISFAGDCTLGTDENFSTDTSFNTKYSAVDDPAYFMSNVASIFANDDLTVANMEGTLTTSTSRQDKTYAFKGPAEYANILVKGNIDVVSLANNHSHDYGEQSYTDTISALNEAGVDSFGYDRIAYRDVKGVKVALIGTYELAKHLDIQDEMKQNIQTAKDNGAQLICVYFHWGTEKETVPDEIQVELGHMAVDAGADLVIGSHPHVIQGYEKYNGRYIVYSLGNFCFGGNPNPSDKDCMIFQQTFTVTGNDVATDDAINVIPCSISSTSSSNNYQPTPAEGSEKTRIEAKIEESNSGIATVSKQVSQASSSSSENSSSSS